MNTSDVSDRIRQLKAKRAEIDDQLKGMPISAVPPNVFTHKAIEDFQIMVENLFLSPDRDFGKNYLKSNHN